MGSNVDRIKERLDIVEVVSGYLKLEKAGTSFKARCPFHNEKTPSFFVSPTRQSYYCFGCGAKGDIISFVEQLEGLDFRSALKLLADKAGIELVQERAESKTEKDVLLQILEDATLFFEDRLRQNGSALKYLRSRGLKEETIKNWRLGYAPGPPESGWRSLYEHLLGLGYKKELVLKAGLAKISNEAKEKEPYDVFRDRVIFPLFDSNGRVIAFSGRALAKDAEPKYLNSPDTPLFTKSEVLYGLDRAKEDIRKKNFAVLVEGQMDLVLSHQAGVKNTVASSGTAFTGMHLERLKRLSKRIIIAFDGDSAGAKAAEKAALLGIAMDFEVKIADLGEGLDPADLAARNPEEWKDALRKSLPAIELSLRKAIELEKDPRKLGKAVEGKILPLIKLLASSIEQAHFVSLVSKLTGIKEDVLWDDLKRIAKPQVSQTGESRAAENAKPEEEFLPHKSQREIIEARLAEIAEWRKELPESSEEFVLLKREAEELEANLSSLVMREELAKLTVELARAEKSSDRSLVSRLTHSIQRLHNEIRELEEKKKTL